MATQKNRNLTLDSLKIILAFMVIGIHTNLLYDNNQFLSYLLNNDLFRIAVPIFLIINGYYFSKSSKKNIQKWLIRYLILYVIWMIFYSFYWVYYPDGNRRSFKILAMFLFTGYAHLWYIISALLSGLMLYLLRKLSDLNLIFIGMSLFIVAVILEYDGVYHFINNSTISYVIQIVPLYKIFFLFSFPFFLLGYLIEKNNFNKKMIIYVFLVGIILLTLEVLFNYYSSPYKNGMEILFSLIIISPALFLLTLKFQIKGSSKYIASMATSIYLIHFFFINLYKENWAYGSMSLTIAIFIVSAIISYFLIIVNKKVKFLL